MKWTGAVGSGSVSASDVGGICIIRIVIWIHGSTDGTSLASLVQLTIQIVKITPIQLKHKQNKIPLNQ